MRASTGLIVVALGFVVTTGRAGAARAADAAPTAGHAPLAAAAPATGSAGADGGVATKIGIVAIGPIAVPADLRMKLEAAAAAGLAASGAAVVSRAAELAGSGGAAIGACADAACRRRIAGVTGTRYWLRGACQIDGSTYRIHLEILDAEADAVVVKRDDTCEICTEAEAAEAANISASALKAALDRAPRAPVPPIPTPAPGPGASVAPSGDAITASPAAPDQDVAAAAGGSGRSTWQRVLPWVAFGAAAGAIGAGAYYLSLNGKVTDCQPWGCPRLYDTGWQGAAWLGVGAALAATGVIVLTLSPRAAPARADRPSAASTATPLARARVVAGPGGVAIDGIF